MGRTLTAERQKLKEEALSLRYDYGLSAETIGQELGISRRVISYWVNNIASGDARIIARGGLSGNNLAIGYGKNSTQITHLEGDCLDLLPSIPDSSVDVLLTDPPYSVMDDYEWDKKDTHFYHQWLSLLKPKMNPQHTGFIFFDSRRMYEFEGILRQYFPIVNRIVWIRKNMSKGRVVRNGLISSYEVIFYFGNRQLDLPKTWGAERFDSCEYAVPQSNFTDKKLHPTQKPINLILQLIRVGTRPGDVVLDCFAGSGVVGRGCTLVGNRKCILMEKEPEYNSLIRSWRNNGYGEAARNNQI